MACEPESPFPPGCARKYSHDRHLNAGGFGAIHVATQRDLDRKVAVKLLSTGFAEDEEQLERFRIEAKATASLSHENIVIVHDHDVEDGVAWIVYELLPGPDLRDILQKGPFSWQETVRLGIQLSGALAEAHRHNILHRDVKPENVIRAGPGHYKLTDFGIARWREGGIKTQAGLILGTPRYMAPEVIRCNEVSAASDIYALGVLLYEVYCGRPPFLDRQDSRIFSQHLTEPPPPVRQFREDLPRGADTIFMRALEKDPEDRFASMKELQDRLEAERDESIGEFKPSVPKVTSRVRVGPSRGQASGRLATSVSASRSRSMSSSSLSTRLNAGEDPSGAVTRWLHELRPWKLMAAMLAVGGMIGAGVMMQWGPDPVTIPSPANPLGASAAETTAAATLDRVAARFEQILPDMVDYCRDLRAFDWRRHDDILPYIEKKVPVAQKHLKSMQELIGELPPDTEGIEKLGDRELSLLARIRAWQFITFHRVAGLSDLTQKISMWRSVMSARSSKDENWMANIQRHLRGAAHGEREGSVMHRRVVSLQHEQLRRLVAAPEVDHPELLAILEDLEHVAHPYRLSDWRRKGEDYTGEVFGEMQEKLTKLGEKDGTPVADLVRLVWEAHLDPAHPGEMDGLQAARKKTADALVARHPAWAPTVKAVVERWKVEDAEVVARRAAERKGRKDGDDDGGSWFNADRGDKRVWGAGWDPEARVKKRKPGASPALSASPGPR